jgi:hypothetical protein
MKSHVGSHEGHVGSHESHVGSYESHVGLHEGYVGAYGGHVGARKSHVGLCESYVGARNSHAIHFGTHSGQYVSHSRTIPPCRQTILFAVSLIRRFVDSLPFVDPPFVDSLPFVDPPIYPTGSQTINAAPWPGSLSMVSRPPSCARIASTIDSPRPAPGTLKSRAASPR